MSQTYKSAHYSICIPDLVSAFILVNFSVVVLFSVILMDLLHPFDQYTLHIDRNNFIITSCNMKSYMYYLQTALDALCWNLMIPLQDNTLPLECVSSTLNLTT